MSCEVAKSTVIAVAVRQEISDQQIREFLIALDNAAIEVAEREPRIAGYTCEAHRKYALTSGD